MKSKYHKLSHERINKAKKAYVTRRVNWDEAKLLVEKGIVPSAGDLVLCRIQSLGHYEHMELSNGRKARILAGDEVLLAFGNRYSQKEFEAEVPRNLRECHLVSVSGIAGKVVSNHANAVSLTVLEPIGIVCDSRKRPLNVSRFSLPPIQVQHERPYTIAVFGTSINSGKNNVATSVIRGLVNRGLRISAAKVTGSALGKDAWHFFDAGANPVLDMLDAGYVSTYRIDTVAMEKIFTLIISHLIASSPDAIVIEVAGSLYQAELDNFIQSPVVKSSIDSAVFASGDALGASAGVRKLLDNEISVLAISGKIVHSPLAMNEAESSTGLRVLKPSEIENNMATLLIDSSRQTGQLLHVQAI